MEESHSEAKNLINALSLVLATLCYTYFVASKLPKGMLRFLSLLPIISLYTILPLSLSRPLTALLIGGFISWIANFKLILYSFNKGPLSSNYAQKSITTFIFFAAFPIKIKENLANQKEPNKVLPLNYVTKFLLFLGFEVVYHFSKNMVVFCCLTYLFIDLGFGVFDLFVGATLGLELDPPSDEPYLSRSLQDFWGRRWNRMISDGLRHTVYEPVKSTGVRFVGSKWAPFPGVMASFIVSGLMHELIYYYMTRVSPTWEVTWFFVLHGVCVLLEMLVKRTLGRKWTVHWAISGPLTVGFVMGTGFSLFFPQLMRNHVDTLATEDFIAFGKLMKEIMRLN